MSSAEGQLYFRCGLCTFLFMTFLVQLSETAGYYSSPGAPKCRCSPGQNCYPDDNEWKAFNTTVGGRLLIPRPTAWPCYASHFDESACNSVKTNYSDGIFRSSLPGSMESWNWEELDSQSCPLESANASNAHCDQGRVPVYGVQISSIDDIQKTILFAARKNLRLYIKNTGHEYAGRSSNAPGSFLLWMHNYRSTVVNMSFVPSGCSSTPTPAVTVGGGAQWLDVYNKVSRETNSQYVVLGGQCTSVGAAGGYVLGGGHSDLGPSFGLAVDSVLQFELVTADGKFHVVNECQDPELFWALRGGGGGTFGVVTSVTYKLHPGPKNLTTFEIAITSSLNSSQIQDLLSVYTKYARRFDDARWGGIVLASPLLKMFAGTFVIPDTKPETFQIIDSVVTDYKALAARENYNFTFNTKSRASYQEYFANPGLIFYINGGRSIIGSRLIPVRALDDPGKLAESLTSALTFVDALVIWTGAGKGVRERDVDGQQTSVHPSWRQAFLDAGLQTVWNADTPQSEIAAKTNGHFSAVGILSKAYPEVGAYFNEAYRETNWQETFWGAKNYQRLLMVKKRVDSDGLFTCNQCVGSEDWDDSGNCRLGASQA